MERLFLLIVLCISTISCSVYRSDNLHIFLEDHITVQPTKIKFKLPKKGLINRQEISSTSHITKEINYLYSDSSYFYISTDIPALKFVNEDKFGRDGSNIFWRNFSNEKLIIGYKHTSREKKDEFDKIIESVLKNISY